MVQKQHHLYQVPVESLFRQVKLCFPRYEYDLKRHGVVLNDEHHEPLGFIRLPLHLVPDENLHVRNLAGPVLYLSLESGHAALCVTEGTDLTYHTTFSAYMTRKKQGFSQIKYLNKKGKSRAGSRVRLAETVEFFERINTTVTELMEEHDFIRIALNCNKTLLPYLYHSRVPFPVDKRTELLYKIPLHIPQSNFSNLEAAIRKLRTPVLCYDEVYQERMTAFVEQIV